MKNRFLLSIVLMLLCFSAARAEVVTIGTASQKQEGLPLSNFWKYSFSEQIYTVAEIGKSGTITDISFYNTSVYSDTRSLEVYLVHTSKSSFSTVEDWITPAASDLAFAGNVGIPAEGMMTISLTQPFQYNGTDNLAIIVNDKSGHFTNDNDNYFMYFGAFGCSEYQSLYLSTDNNPFDAQNIVNPGSEGYFTLSKNKSQVQLTFSGGGSSDCIQIGSCLGTSNLLPTDNYYKYSLTQQIYTKDEIGGSATLESISFLNASQYERNRNLDIYLMHTSKEAFADGSDWIDCSGAQKVFSGEVIFFIGEWTTIVFDTPFEYNGTDNLVVVVDDNTGDYTSGTPFYVFDAPGHAMYIRNDYTNYDIASISEYTGTNQDVKNQIKFNAAPNRARPTNLQVTDVTYNSATISWEGEGSRWNVQYREAGASEWLSTIGTPSKSETLYPLAPETQYQVRVQIYEGSVTEDGWRYAYFTTPEQYPRPTNLTVSEITANTALLKWTENSGATSWQIELDGATTYEISGEPDFLLEGLSANADHTVKVRSIIDKGSDIYSNWSESKEFHTPEVNPVPTDIVVTPYATYADISWTGTSEMYIVKYRKSNAIFFDGFENGLDKWTIYTEGEAPYETGWYINGSKYQSGAKAARAASWINGGGSFDADNWLISPAIELDGTLKFWQRSELESYRDLYEVKLSTTGNAIEDFTIELQTMQESTAEWSEVAIDLSSYAGQTGYIAIHHKCYDMSSLYIDDFGVYPNSEGTWSTISTSETNVTITGLEANTVYEYQIIGCFDGEPDADTEIGTFTTTPNNTPTDIAVTPSSTSATMSWSGAADSYKVRYVGPSDSETDLATIILRTDDVWGDGSGYQMLIDADATAYGTIIPEIGPLTDGGDVSPSVYAEFEYKIPENADGALNTSNIVLDNQVSIQIPAGTYDFCITNPTPGDKMWIASQGGNVGGRHDDYVFKAGYIYEFYVYHGGSNDATDLNITAGMYNWDEAITIDDATSPLTIEGLEQETPYALQVIGIKDGEEYASDITYFTTESPLVMDAYADNYDLINNYHGKTVDVTLSSRTYRKNGTWQTICLPFDVELVGSPLEGADVRIPESVNVVRNCLIVNCFNPVNKIEAGVPYIIRWESAGEDIVNPTFYNVVIDENEHPISLYDDDVAFQCIYSYFATSPDPTYSSYYYVAGSPALAPISNGCELLSFDAYFLVDETLNGTIQGVAINTGDMSVNDLIATGISLMEDGRSQKEGDAIYNVAGQRLSKKQKGVNIVNGKKVAIK